MITPSQIREKKISTAQDGYDRNEVNELLVEVIESYEAVCAENKELYRKMEILANKIEEYRENEDTIKTAIISAQKTAHQVTSEANALAEKTVAESNASAQQTVKDAQEKADKIIGEARDYVANLTKEKSVAADELVAQAQEKANTVISSARLVAQDTVDKAKELTQELVSKAREDRAKEQELIAALKAESDDFKARLVALYEAQLSGLTAAEITYDSSEKQLEQEIDQVLTAAEEISIDDDMMEIPTEPETDDTQQESEVQEAEEIQEEEEEITEAEEEVIESEKQDDNDDFIIEDEIDEVDEIINEIEQSEPAFEVIEEGEDDQPPTQEEIEDALNAFNDNEITPVEGTGATIPVIDEEPEFEEMPFESFFNVGKTDVNTNETISLTAPDEDEDDDDDKSKFKGFFKKRK